MTSSSATQIKRDSCRINGKFDIPAPRKGSNVFEVTRYPRRNVFHQSLTKAINGILETENALHILSSMGYYTYAFISD